MLHQNGVVNEVVTVVMMKTKSIETSRKAYYFLKDNFTTVNEYEIERYNDRVFSVFRKYNEKNYRVSFIDCSSVVIANKFNLDYVVSLNRFFRKFYEVELFELK